MTREQAFAQAKERNVSNTAKGARWVPVLVSGNTWSVEYIVR